MFRRLVDALRKDRPQFKKLDSGAIHVSRSTSPQCRGGFDSQPPLEVIGFARDDATSTQPDEVEMKMISAPYSIYFQQDDESMREALQRKVDVNCDSLGCGPKGERCFLSQKFQQELTPHIKSRLKK